MLRRRRTATGKRVTHGCKPLFSSSSFFCIVPYPHDMTHFNRLLSSERPQNLEPAASCQEEGPDKATEEAGTLRPPCRARICVCKAGSKSVLSKDEMLDYGWHLTSHARSLGRFFPG